MKILINTLQQRIGLLVSIVALVVLINNIIDRFLRVGTIIYVISDVSVWMLFLTILPFVVSIFIENRLLKVLQVMLILLTGVMNIMDAYNEVYGPGLFLTGWVLMWSYGFLEQYKKIKNVLFFLFLIIVSQVSAIVHNKGAIYAGLATFEYFLFIMMFILTQLGLNCFLLRD